MMMPRSSLPSTYDHHSRRTKVHFDDQRYRLPMPDTAKLSHFNARAKKIDKSPTQIRENANIISTEPPWPR